jgi:hypothetical protein
LTQIGPDAHVSGFFPSDKSLGQNIVKKSPVYCNFSIPFAQKFAVLLTFAPILTFS